MNKKKTKSRKNSQKKSPLVGLLLIIFTIIVVYFGFKLITKVLNSYSLDYLKSTEEYEKFMNWFPEDYSSSNNTFPNEESVNQGNNLNETNNNLSNITNKNDNSFTKHGLEIPVCKGTLSDDENDDHEVHTYNGFTLCYRENYEVAEWVAYSLTKEELNAVTGRSDNFKSDTKISTGSAELSDYKGSGYDRGHLAPAADLEWSKESCNDSFLLSNMTPQAPQFNRGLWKTLEEQVRKWAGTFGEVFVVTGPILEKPASEYNSIGKNKVSVPEYFYKVLIADISEKQDGSDLIGCAFILPNQKCEGSIWDYAVSIDEVEKRSGIDFFSLIPDETENSIEKMTDYSKWK